MAAYMQEQARDYHGRWTSAGQGMSQRRAEIVKLNEQLDARNRSRTGLFGPAAKAVIGGAHSAGIHAATAGKTLAQVSAMGATTATVKGQQP